MKENLLIFACLALGLAAGMTGTAPAALAHPGLPLVLLSGLVFLVGITLGGNREVFASLRGFRWRMLLLPLFTIAGTLLFSGLAVFLLHDLRLTDCLAVGSGFGYYSLSSVLITNLKGGAADAAALATVALLANIVRELVALFGIPLFARLGGRLAPISVAGINSMDVCLPMIVRSSGSELIPLAVLHGLALELSVPLLIGLFCR